MNSHLDEGKVDVPRHESEGAVAPLFSDEQMNALGQVVLGVLASERSPLQALVQRLEGLATRDDVVAVSKDLEKVRRDIGLLRGRMSDMDSLNRSTALASRFTVTPYASDVAPRGSAFREGEGDFRPRSPFAQ